MTVGLPGTGIGGLFYFGLALLMPFRELPKLLTGRSSWSRWRLIGFQYAIITGIFVVMWGQAWLLGRIGLLQRLTLVESLDWTRTMASMAIVGSAMSLAAILAGGSVLNWYYQRTARRLTAAGSKPALRPAPTRSPVYRTESVPPVEVPAEVA